jgi:DNA-binding GntR family transcriptional regulator
MRVSTWSPTDIRRLFDIRQVLERHAGLSALPLNDDEGDPLAPVRARLADMRAAERWGDRLGKDDAHRAFHAAVVGLAANRQLELALGPIPLKLQLPMAVNLRREAQLHSPDQGLDRHAAILTALESDDVRTVLDALDRHGDLTYPPALAVRHTQP